MNFLKLHYLIILEINNYMYFLDILYYHYYLFYRQTLKDPEPELTTTLSLSFSLALLLNGIIDLIALQWCIEIAIWVQFAITVFIIVLIWRRYHVQRRVKGVIKAKPSLWDNRLLSIIVCWLFFLVSASWLFWGPIYGKEVLSRCK